jgi:hypothetical protein
VWAQHPQIENALLTFPYSNISDPADDYLGGVGGDALT